jgi:hypothetical protein
VYQVDNLINFSLDIFIKIPFGEDNETLVREYFGVQQVVTTNGEVYNMKK